MNDARRFLFLTATPQDVSAGSGTYMGITVLQRALTERGCRVQILSLDDRFASLSYTMRRLLFNARIARSAARLRPDICIGFDLDGFLLQHVRGIRVIQSIKGVVGDELTFESGTVRASLWLQSRAEMIAVHRASQVLTTSHFSAERIGYHYGYHKPIAIVPEAIDLAAWARANPRQSIARPDRPTVLCVAHLYPRKDVASLVRAMRILTDRGRDCDARIIGHGPCQADIAHLVDQLNLGRRVQVEGHVPFATLAQAYQSATVFCLPSRQEGFGIVYLEAMAAGLPIVACRTSAVPEVVPDRECGLLATPGDPVALANELEKVLFNAPYARQLGANGREHVRQFDKTLLADRFLRAIEVL